MSWHRMTAVVRKEMVHIVRDPRNLFLVTISPAFLLFLLSYIFSFEVEHLELAVLDLDRTPLSRQYLATLTSDQDLVLVTHPDRYDQILPLLRRGEAEAALVIPPGFAAKLQGGRPAPVQAIIDGADPLAGRQVSASLTARSQIFAAERSRSSGLKRTELIEVSTQVWYNAGLESLYSMVPGLMAIVLLMPTMAFALALAKEKETSTLENLFVSPVSGLEYFTGKFLAYAVTGLVSAVLAWLVAVLWFRVPFRGNLILYLGLVGLYFLACMGVTIVIASFVKSQQTALFTVLLIFLVPSFFLAGLITPVSTTSWSAYLISSALPSTHFVDISRSVFLKGLGLTHMLRPALVLLGMGVGAVGLGLLLFKKRVA